MPHHKLTGATIVTIARSTLCLPTFLLLRDHRLLPAIGVVATFALGDLLDGHIARSTNTVTQLGAQLDSAADRLMMLAILAAVVVGQLVAPWLSIVLVTSITVQTSAAAVYHHRRRSRPKTLIGPLVGGTLLIRLITEGVAAQRLEVAIAVISVNAMVAYTRHLLPRWSLSFRPRHAPGAVVGNYVDKWQGSTPGAASVWTLANLITAARVMPGTMTVVAVAQHRMWWFVVAAFVFVALDAVDGFVARAMDQVSVLGRYLDVIIDKSTLVGVLVAACATGIVPMWMGVASLARIAVIAIASLVAQRQGWRRPRNLWSLPANLSVLVALAWPERLFDYLVIASATQNALHFCVVVARQRRPDVGSSDRPSMPTAVALD
jgi:phosphatidylglycerophosphate synthase